MARSILSLSLMCLLCLAGTAAAQLQDTSWNETVTATVDQVSNAQIGQDISMPENMSQNAVDGAAGCTAAVSFGPPGPPEGTASVSAFAELSGPTLAGVAVLNVNFYARVIQTSSPPVTVTIVPVTMTATGTADASASSGITAQCFSDANFLLNGNEVFHGNAEASSNPGSGLPASDSFDMTELVNAPVGGVFSCALIAQASISGFGVDAGGGVSTAFVDPVIEVADQTIPGTSDSYRDHFTMEFGSGYYALGDPTPVEPITWGKIKSLYQD